MTDQSTQPPIRLTIAQYESLQPIARLTHGAFQMSFATPSEMTFWRVKTIREKEPCTLEWIESFQADEVLVDCGANVGMYSVWSAVTRGARVFAFEPEAQNFALLNRNIQLNNLSEKVVAFCLGLSDEAGLSRLYMTDLRAGGSCHAVGEALDFQLQPQRTRFVQGCVAARLDDLIAESAVPRPDHIKIDVDGFEHKVLAGARKTLESGGVKSLLIETNPHLAEHRAMVSALGDLGYSYDEAQVAKAARKQGAFEGVAEYIFRR